MHVKSTNKGAARCEPEKILQQPCTELSDRERGMGIGLKTKSDKNKLQCGCLRSTIKTRHATMQTSFETTTRASARVEFEHGQLPAMCRQAVSHVIQAWRLRLVRTAQTC